MSVSDPWNDALPQASFSLRHRHSPRGNCDSPESAWHDTHVKHTWNAVPDRWESLGCPPSSTAIDLYLVLKPYYENALIDVLYDVSNPRHSKYILSSTHICGCPLPDMVHTYQRNRFLSFPRNPQARHRLT